MSKKEFREEVGFAVNNEPFENALRILDSLAIENIFLGKVSLKQYLEQYFQLIPDQVDFLVETFGKNGDNHGK